MKLSCSNASTNSYQQVSDAAAYISLLDLLKNYFHWIVISIA